MPRSDDPPYRRRRALVALLMVFILIVGVGVPAAIMAPVPAAVADVQPALRTETAAASPVFPNFGASAVGVVGMSGVLATSGDQKPRPIASITKVITALVVLQAKPLTTGAQGPTLTFTQQDVDYLQWVLSQDGSYALVQPGWHISERQALEVMLIHSANNYAEKLAVWAYGSVPAYLVAARAWLKTNGLDDTTLVDSNGLSDGDRSTPTDLVHLGELALAEPTVADIVDTQQATEPNIGQIQNTNALLGRFGVDGIKTGTTNEAGACLLFGARLRVGQRTVQVVAVILDAKSHPILDSKVPALLASVQAGLHDVVLGAKGQAYASYRMRWGGVAKAIAADRESVLVWGLQAVKRTVAIRNIGGGPKGMRVGTVTYAVAGRTVQLPLVLDRQVLAAPVWWRLTHPLR